MNVARSVASRSSCTRSQVGAVVVVSNTWTFVGYNGPEAGELNCDKGGCPRGQKSFEELPSGSAFNGHAGFCTAIHAEMNALRKFLEYMPAGTSTAIMYTTREPCAGCWSTLRNRGFTVNQIVWDDASA